MKFTNLTRFARGASLLIILAMMISALSSCGVIIINKPETEAPATTVSPETETSPDVSGNVTEEDETTNTESGPFNVCAGEGYEEEDEVVIDMGGNDDK